MPRIRFAPHVRTRSLDARREALASGALVILSASDVPLVTFALSPTAGSVAGDVWTLGFLAANATAAASATGTAAKAILYDAMGQAAADPLDVGLAATGVAIVLNDLAIVAGELVQVTQATITATPGVGGGGVLVGASSGEGSIIVTGAPRQLSIPLAAFGVGVDPTAPTEAEISLGRTGGPTVSGFSPLVPRFAYGLFPIGPVTPSGPLIPPPVWDVDEFPDRVVVVSHPTPDEAPTAPAWVVDANASRIRFTSYPGA